MIYIRLLFYRYGTCQFFELLQDQGTSAGSMEFAKFSSLSWVITALVITAYRICAF